MDTNTEALELLRQIAADTKATREAVEALSKKEPPVPSEAIAKVLSEINKAKSSADYNTLMAR